MIRLGKRQVEDCPDVGASANSETGIRPRPIKMVFETEDSKVKVLSSAENLRNKKEGGLSKIFMHQDLTPKERQARKLLVGELKSRRANGEQNLTILNGKIVSRQQHQGQH